MLQGVIGRHQKRAGRHFSFLKRAGRHQKGAGRPALRKRPRQNTEVAMFTYNLTKTMIIMIMT